MKPITLRLYNNVSDAFYYMGKLFLLTSDGNLKYISQALLYQKYIGVNEVSEMLLLNQVLFSNEQLKSWEEYKPNNQFYRKFNSFWERYTDKRFEFEIEDADLTLICVLPEGGVLDFVIYAQRAFLANRKGLYECQLNIDGNTVEAISGFQRVFDAKSININPRVGTLLISTNSDGLFSGGIFSLKDQLQIGKNAIEKNSVRTGWAAYNFINYENQINANFFFNETVIEQSDESTTFKNDDGGYQNRKISQLAIDRKSLSQDISYGAKNKKVVFAFNSLAKSFLVTEEGSIYYSELDTNGHNGILAGYRQLRYINLNVSKLGIPLSAHTVGGGTVYEFFSEVYLVKTGIVQSLGEVECKQIRTFASSKWYKNIVMTVTDNFCDIHSIHPYV